MVVLVTCKNKKDQLELKALEWSQYLFHCKSMEIFSSAAQGQLTPQSEVGSGGNSIFFKLSWFSSLPARMKIQLKIKVIRWSQHNTLIFQTLKGNSVRSQKMDVA